LKSLRHRKIGYIGGSEGPTISDHRYQAFVKAMKKYELPVNPQHVRIGNYRVSGGGAAMTELLSLQDQPTALLTANDLTAIGALRALHQRGLSAPGDLSIIGFDDIELADTIWPPLTTLRLPRPELANIFFQALEMACIDPHAVGQQYSIRTNLVVRNSTGPARRSRRIA
jgi:DNA-binding LacI/PurR family transcriptional regulator